MSNTNDIGKVETAVIKFEAIVAVHSPIQTSVSNAQDLEAFIQYFDNENEVNLTITGKYNSPHMKRLAEAYHKQEIIKVVIGIGTRDK